MAQSTDKTLKQLIINQMPRSVYNAKKAAGELDPEQVYLPDTAYDDSLGITAAAPGQIIKVKTVQDGKPTEWEAVDGGVQPDWNQNDETAADYVKNRPFYTGNPVETVLVEESTVTFDKNGGLYMAKFPSTFEATVGETYKVSWDGTTYECACVDFNNAPVIGNLSIVGEGSDTGEPFVMGILNGKEIQIITADPSASHTFSISGFVSEVVKIDKKYLPDTVATKSEVEAAQTTANAAQTTAENAQSTANAAQTTANAAQTTAENAQTTANAALPKTGGTMSGNLTIDTENDSFQTIISPGGMALQYVPSTGDVNDELVISAWNAPRIVAREGGDSGFKLSVMGLALGCTSTTKDGIHLRHSNGSSNPGEIVIQHTNLNNHAKERISIASTGEIECNNRLKFNCGSEIEVVQAFGKTGGSAIILHSSTPNSTKKFKINVDDSGVPTITDESDSTNTWKAADLYEKPDTGIPKTDLAADVQTSLDKADTSISYNSQTLTDAQKQQARQNIGAGQPDWNQNDSTQPDYVKNRPFYTGNPVETVLVEESTVSFAAVDGMYMGQLESTFSATVGETYKVSWDGTAYECTCVNFNDTPAIGNLSIMGAGSDTGEPFLMGILNGKAIQIVTADTSASHTFSISGFTQEVVKIDAKYLPNTVATKSEVEATQEVLDGVFSSIATFTFDKQTSGRDTFVFNGFNYYKISDFNPAPENVISFKGTAEDGGKSSIIMIGSNCVGYGFFIVVAAAGRCSLPVTETVTYSFDAPSAGLYACYEEGNTAMTAGTGEFTLRASTGSLYITGLLLKSSTAYSTKQFRITVDDSGVPTITDESDSTNTWKPTNLPTVTSSDSGKFLRVSDTGEWVAETVLSATVSNNTLIIR